MVVGEWVNLMVDFFDIYVGEINKAYTRGDATEHTHRPALKSLIEAIGKKVTATNEPKRIDCGAPDYVISRKVKSLDQTIGYVEAKDIGTSLTQILKTEQVKKRYLPSLHNFILTDYIEFRWYVGAEHRMTVKLADETGGKFKASEKGAEQLKELFDQFIGQEPVKIKSAKDLASKMAGKAKLLRDIIGQTFEHESEKGSLHGQYEAFKKVLLHDLEKDQFADIYAQTISYGLFAARCYINDKAVWGKDKHAAFHGVDGKGKKFTREKAAYLLPKTNPFLRNIFSDIAGPRLDDRIAWLVDDLISLLRNTNMSDVLRGFGRKTKRQDPVIHFYETFLAEYDAKLKKSRGVYYTPEPVVSYIVRSVDWILKEKFGLKKGLADNSKIKVKVGDKEKEFHRCLVLDPAVGTGTFLYEVIRQIQKNMARQKGAWSGYVKKHLLPRIFGFELMMAPYAVCHMKLGLELADSGYDFEGDDRLGVYLTNTLEEAEDISGFFGFARDLAEEAQEANKVKKDMPVMVVLGNPPYSGHSANKGEWIGGLVRDYYQVDGKPLGERNPKWLQDDYVKFIRYGQHRIQETGSGVLAFITNHGYLDNPTFRGMRQQLMETFTDIYILDLHGSSKKKEVCPDGSPDKNVFDIQQGVSIGIFAKEPNKKTQAIIHHYELWGERKNKYTWLNSNDLNMTKWVDANPQKPFYLFNPQDKKLLKEYDGFHVISNLMDVNVLGFQTHRDHFAIDFDLKAIEERISKMRGKKLTDEQFSDLYDVKSNRDWRVKKSRQKLRQLENWDDYFRICSYRPFDSRYCYFSDIVMDYPRRELISHVAGKDNLCIGLGRQGLAVNDPIWSLISVSKVPVDANIFRRGGINVFPLYLYPKEKKESLFDDDGGDWGAGEGGRVPNLDKGFVDEFAGKLGLKFVSDGRGDLVDSCLRRNDKEGRNDKGGEGDKVGEVEIAASSSTSRNDVVVGTFGPEDIFYYIYGVFHSPGYRKRYSEFLKIDFPRVPMTGNVDLFRELCKAGEELVGLHLMESEVLEDNSNYPDFNVDGDREVEKGYPKYVDQSDEIDRPRVYINKGQYFEGVGAEVWEFHVGGYQVCEKWLKDRRGRKLSYNDIEHYQKITVALGRTINVMNVIDEVIEGHGGWPIK